MKSLRHVAFLLTVIAAINLGLFSLASFDIYDALLGDYPALVNLVYLLTGASGVWVAVTYKK